MRGEGVSWWKLAKEGRLGPSVVGGIPLCGLCHEPSDRKRWIVGVGYRTLHETCEQSMAFMGYDIRDDAGRRIEPRVVIDRRLH